MELAGKTAMVTGSGRNIGRAIALELAARGADIVVNARSDRAQADAVADQVRALGRRATVALGDVSDEATVARMREQVDRSLGGVDILVSNAALRPYQSFLDTTLADWRRVLDTQLTASFLLAKAFVPGMIDRDWGRIIHVTGPDAFSGVVNRCHNVVAKGGLRALTKCLALELGPHHITVNDVAPAHIAHPGFAESHPVITRDGKDVRDDTERLADVPVGRLGTPEDVAYACAFLASPRADYFTGALVPVFGGMLMVP